ncbi:hypothetical protein D3C77_330710 [compost metagenome]
MYFVSAAHRAFYHTSVHADFPEDAKEISDELHIELFAGQNSGMTINFDTYPPSLMAPPSPSVEQLAVNERVWRDGQLSGYDHLIARHRDEHDMDRPSTLTQEQFTELLLYRQALRDWPQSLVFPDNQQRPTAPAWITAQIK